jgi:amino acid adenylation domain-containing protein
MTGLLHEPFFDAARQHAGRLAVVDDAEALSYAALAERVRRAAWHLQAAGVGPGDRVAILLERSVHAVVAIQATLSLGAVYVPFDVRWPAQRRQQLLVSTQATVVVLDRADQLDGPVVAAMPQRLTPGELAAPVADAPADTHVPAITPDDLAYILFTSGTTGEPKGVCVSHRAARYFVDWACSETALACTDRVAGVSSFTFDLSIFDIFATLSAGATLYLYDHRKVVLSTSLARFLARQAISVLYTVPTTLSLLGARGAVARHDLGALRVVMFAGEPFAIAAFERLSAALPAQVVYYNLYGPTETNVCTAHRMNGSETAAFGIPIGQPLPGTEIVALPFDDAAQFGSGAVELCVFGPSLMQGYWRDDRVEASHWWHDPASGRRAYRTGDVCRLGAGGEWFFLGRADTQIKINGFRVEAEEVENALLADPALAQCAVVAVQDPNEVCARLVAFVVMREGTPGAAGLQRLAAVCAARLPHYMRPHDYVPCTELPTKVSGKTDRAALAARYIAHRGTDT